MNEQDRWLLDLYDGDGSAFGPARPSEDRSEDPFGSEGSARFREIKALLDTRPGRKPSAEAVNALLVAAAEEAAPVNYRDRPPVRRSKMVGLRMGAVSAALVALIAVVAIWQTDALDPDTEATSRAEHMAAESSHAGPSAPDNAGAEGRITRRPSNIQPPPQQVVAQDLTGRQEAGMPAELRWDEQDDVIELHQRIEMIGSGVDQGWEAPAVPLEMMPTSQEDGGIMPVGQPR